MRVSTRGVIAAIAALAAGPVLAQGAAAQPPPAQQQPPQPAPPPAAGSSSTAGSQGQSSTAQPSSPGASSQQVVVNPPQPVPPSAPPSSTTVVNPPPPSATTVVNPPPSAEVTVVERRDRPNPMATVATDAAYGGVAGLLVGVGVALVNQWDRWRRDTMVGAGTGLILGAAVGVAHAAYDQREWDRARRRVASAASPPAAFAGDGLNRTDRDPVVSAPTVGLAVAF